MMKILNQLTIKTRMILAFFLVVTIFVLFGMFTIKEMNALGDLTKTLYEHPLRVSNAALAARIGVLKMHRSLKDIVLSDSALGLENDIHAVRGGEQMVYDNLDIVKQYILGSEGRNLEDRARTTFFGWKPIRDEVIELVMEGKKEAATKISKNKSADHVNLLEMRLQDLSAYARRKADGFMMDATKVETKTIRNTILFIMLTAAFSSIIAYLLISSILSSILVLKDKMSDITETGNLSKAELVGNHEITDMSEHFNKLIDRLRGQLWLKGGQNELNRELSGRRTYDDLVTGAIGFISKYVDACSGALYHFDPRHSRCELKASFAFVERQHLGNAYGLGEGIIGQVAVEKSPILLRNITREMAVGETGTVSEPPRAIYALPIMYEGELYGVMEVASFENIDGIKQEFLDSASHTVSTYLYTISQREKIGALLEDTQKANEKLQVQAEELQSMNSELQNQTSELNKQNLELELQREQVEEANRLKSEFLSNLSHELRTPLNSINALSRILLIQTRDNLSDEEINYLTIIERNGKHLLSLINNILDLSKIEAGKMDLNPVRFSIKNLLETIVEGLEPVAREKGITLQLNIREDLPWIESDEARVHQIIQNIIGNGLKFTEEGGVMVSASRNKTRVRIQIADTGIGIQAKDLSNIFEEFRQVDGSLSRRFEGTGLGLAIAQKATQILGGQISVDSTPGKGSTFTISLPIEYAGLPGNNHPWQAHGSPESMISSPKKILIIDDDPEDIKIISENISQLGYDIITATSGREGLRLAEIHRPFAITLDLIMAEMDGWEALLSLKRNPDTADIPVIIVSTADDRKTGFALGAVGYVTKPVNKNQLISEIYQITGSSPHTVMIVDDNEMERLAMAGAVQEEGARVVLAENGAKCLEMLAQTRPDVLLLDLMMPEMDGFEVLNRIRAHPETKDLPVIIVTAKDLSEKERQQLESRTLSVLAKGTHTSGILVKEIRNALKELEKSPDTGGIPQKTSQKRILLVEDNEAAVIQVGNTLRAVGYTVDVTRDGRQALDYLKETVPDAIILDLMIPGIDGFEVLERLRADKATCNIPVLVLTAKDLTEEDLRKLGANNIRQLVQKGGVDRERLVQKTRLLLGEKPEQASRQPFPGGKEKHRNRPLIMVVEDNMDNMTTVKAIIKDKYDNVEAHDGETGLEKILAHQPDLVLLDMSLPRMDGFAVVAGNKEA